MFLPVHTCPRIPKSLLRSLPLHLPSCSAYLMLLSSQGFAFLPSSSIVNKWRTMCAIVPPPMQPTQASSPGVTADPHLGVTVDGSTSGSSPSLTIAGANNKSTPLAVHPNPFSHLRPELTAALISHPYGTLARLKFLLEKGRQEIGGGGETQTDCGGASLAVSSESDHDIETNSFSGSRSGSGSESPAARRSSAASDPRLLEALVMEVLSTPDAVFSTRYPEYSGWLAH